MKELGQVLLYLAIRTIILILAAHGLIKFLESLV